MIEYNDSVVAIVIEGELTLKEERDPSSSLPAPAGK